MNVAMIHHGNVFVLRLKSSRSACANMYTYLTICASVRPQHQLESSAAVANLAPDKPS